MDQVESGREWAKKVLKRIELEERELEAAIGLVSASEKGILVCEGDSWFDYRPFSNRDILKWLNKIHNYDVRETPANGGDTLEQIAYGPNQLAGINKILIDIKNEGKEPSAILLSAGGNDITHPVLKTLLNHKASGLPAINESMVSSFYNDHIKGLLHHWVGAMNELCETHFNKTYPLFVHGYCYTVPDGDAFGWDWIEKFPGPWLKPSFEAKGYWEEDGSRRNKEDALQETTKIMEELMNRFNEVLKKESEKGFFHYIDFRYLETNSLPTGYKDWWVNELHPDKEGFKILAKEFSDQIENILAH
ncbi:MAG: hypothetical protein HOM14_17985 [Gammaproteobacteria bacterium]|nr:hypothetical protein [Gammaproteobacteria bacterium]MBT4681900.1 hypothetical protein [Chloroflexota bacterium]MBT4193686.1 hypothetical protein [Gammaproteobacteria bacterium]MBT6457580.1 hypothetical protein [Gammaproteobacteria bacterium]MBT6553244.1 hypothetical protein [Gammaproteobacteria bacterium]